MLFLLLLFAVAGPAIAQPEDTKIAAGKFLVASDYWMRDPRFRSTVILLVEHDDNGTLGLILNHPTKMTVHQALPEYAGAPHAANPVYIGGPVAPSTFVILVRTNQQSEGLFRVINNVSFSADKDTIQEWLDAESRSSRIRVFAGYSGWGKGQLEAEMKIGGWRLLPANATAVFDSDPEHLWPELTNQKFIQTRLGPLLP